MLTVGRHLESLDVPGRQLWSIAPQRSEAAAGYIDPDKAKKLRIQVRRRKHAPTVSGKLRGAIRDDPLAGGREPRELPRGDIQQVQFTVGDRTPVLQQHPGSVVLHIEHRPTAAGNLQNHFSRFRQERVQTPDIGVAAIATGRIMEEPAAVVGEVGVTVAAATVGQQRRLTLRQVESVQLVEFSTPDILAEDDKAPLTGLELPSGHWLRRKGQLAASPTGLSDGMQLEGIGKPGTDEHFPAGGMP